LNVFFFNIKTKLIFFFYFYFFFLLNCHIIYYLYEFFQINKEYPQLIQRLVKIHVSDIYKISVLKKVLERSHVLITSQSTVEQIASHYHKYRWHQSTGSEFQSIGNFPMRYGLNKTVRNKLQSM
jgi:hypothetical protein